MKDKEEMLKTISEQSDYFKSEIRNEGEEKKDKIDKIIMLLEQLTEKYHVIAKDSEEVTLLIGDVCFKGKLNIYND